MSTKPVKKPSIKKSFRLYDFVVIDDFVKDGASSDASSGSDEENQISNSNPSTLDKRFVIQMFGINERGETCCLYMQEYQPFFYIKVGDNWTKNNMNALVREIKDKIGKYFCDSIVSSELVDHHKLYGFSGGKKCKFMKIVFQNTIVMNKVKNLWYAYPKAKEQKGNIQKSKENKKERQERYRVKFIFQGVSLELYESNIPPLLRYFHIRNISPSGWVSFRTDRTMRVVQKNTTCTYEYICPLKELIPEPEKETRVPYKICSFDIEASSSHGDFPVPVKTYKRLATNLVDAFFKQAACLNIDKQKANAMLLKVFYAAFDYGKFDDIDIVYPKKKISKETVKDLVNILLKTPMQDVKLIDGDGEDKDRSYIMTIDAMFEKMKEDADVQGTEGDDEQVAGTNDDKPIYFKKKDLIPSIKIDKKLNIIDFLLNSEYSRDIKIHLINDMLTRCNKFPELKGDEVTFIGSTFLRYGETEPYLNHCIVVGDCDDVDGAVIESVITEKDLLLKWTETIQRENPDIIIGYNIFGFDYEFMFRRAEQNGCELEFLLLSKKKNELCAKEKNNKIPDSEVNDQDDLEINNSKSRVEIENTKLVIASGEYDLRFFKMTGRLQIDMYAYFRRDFNLASYKLDDVAGEFISDNIKKIVCTEHPKFGEVTELYSQNLMGLHVGDFIHIGFVGFTSDYYKDGKKFRILDIEKGREDPDTKATFNVILISGHEHIDSAKPIKWTMAKDDVTPQDIFRLANGDSSDRAIVAKYCIQDCNLVHHLMNKIDVITGYVEMSSICSVPISFLVFRGQGIKLTSYVAKKCREKDTLMPDIEKSGEMDGYEGAIVLPPKCSMYMDNPVACVDYASLYPSSMISQNYSHDSKVWSKEYDLEGNQIKVTGQTDASGNFMYDNMPGFQYIDMEFDTFKYIRKTPTSKAEKTKAGKIVCRWAQFPDNKKGVMPSILEELLKARAFTRKLIKTTKDPFMQNILDKRQLGYKVTANSLYGQCGSRTSTFYEKDVAAATTATGRMMITYAKRMIEEVYGDLVYNTTCNGAVKCKAEYVYGDTDSVFFTFNLENPNTGEKIRGKPALEATIEIAQDVAALCTRYLKPPMELTYEKTLMPFILLSKKRYVGMLYETDANKGKLKFMGLSLKRRDSCDYLKDVYGGILKILMDTKRENTIKVAIDYLNDCLQELVNGNVPMDKLMITKALRSDYKNPATIAHKVLADRIAKRDPGNKPKPGDRMKFVHFVCAESSGKKALQGEKIETPEFILQNNLQIDYNHYITNQLMKPLQQLFGLALIQIWELQNKKTAIKTYEKELDKLADEFPDMETFMKKKEKYCSTKIKALLFDKVLDKIHNTKYGIQTISSFFKPV
uniref:DNA-directed DNA polymerase n=1 Tax=viral metagenome TaxID=1070528 RepID=A0A6C0JJ24_9ZZZZ